MLNKDNIDQLLLKHLLQENAVEEEQLLKEWLGHDPEHQRYFERFRRHHIHLQAAIQSGRIQGQYIEFASCLKRRHIRRLFIRVAAIALILLGGGLSFYLIHTPSLIPTLAEVPIHPGSSKAILHLSSGTAIPVNTTAKKKKEKDGTLIRISNEGVLNYAESANISTANLINRLEIPRGGEFKIKLADGTEVWLNAETELRYPTVFSSLERRVKLQGEGYFKVAKNEKQPFIVEVGDIEVKVYGTQFNISTQNKDNIETVLVSGSVSIRHHDQETHLNPSQKAAYTSSGKLTIEEVDVLPYITWKDGNFMFQNESLESIMNKLARWYDLDVFYLNEQTKNIHLSGMMTRYKEVSELFHYFEKISTARFIIKGRTVTVK